MARCRARAARRRRHRRRAPTWRPSATTPSRTRRRRRRVPTATPGSSRWPGCRPSATCRCSASAAGCRSWRSRPAGRSSSTCPTVVGHDDHCPRRASTPRTTPPRSAGTRLAAILGTDAARRADLPPPGGAPERSRAPAYVPCGVARRRHARGDGGPDGGLPARRAVAPRGRRRRSALRGARGRGGGVAAAAASDAAVPRSAVSTGPPGDNRPMTKLNRLAIAAGAASALGALAAAGKGVNAAMGGRPTGGAARAGCSSRPAYRAGAFHNTSPRHLVDAVGPARRAAPVPRERRRPGARPCRSRS